MISYKLAKQLKDAGYPQRETLYGQYYDTDRMKFPKPCRINGSQGAIDVPNRAYVPSLEELLFEIGEAFGNVGISLYKKGYYAMGKQRLFTHEEGAYCFGKTIYEAVAKLYLNLNE